jgi:hypothetical protein
MEKSMTAGISPSLVKKEMCRLSISRMGSLISIHLHGASHGAPTAPTPVITAKAGIQLCSSKHPPQAVIPAKAGIQLCSSKHGERSWIPAFAGMTELYHSALAHP